MAINIEDQESKDPRQRKNVRGFAVNDFGHRLFISAA